VPVSSMPGWLAAVPVSLTSIERSVMPATALPKRPFAAPSGLIVRPAISALAASVTTSVPFAVRIGLMPAANSVSPAGAPTWALVSATPSPSSLSPAASVTPAVSVPSPGARRIWIGCPPVTPIASAIVSNGRAAVPSSGAGD
jgi:hypothetical protein